MNSGSHYKLTFDTFDSISRLTSPAQVAMTFRDAVEKLGITSLGINGLPPPREGADPVILTEATPGDFRDCYVRERLYLADHICAHARETYEVFRYKDAPHDRTQGRGSERFMQALVSFGIGKGLVVPIGRPANIPACVWLAGEDPDLDDGAQLALQSIALFAASKAYALTRPPDVSPRAVALTPREREVLRWISDGKTSWEIGVILRVSERAINKTIADAMAKLDAVTRAQAVVTAIRIGAIDL